jgi:hypothetical protein
MKPVNIVLLVLAGALGGAVVMRVAERPHAPAPLVARVQAEPPKPAEAPKPSPAVIDKPPIEVVANTAAPIQAARPAAPPAAPPARAHVASVRSKPVPVRRPSAAPSDEEPLLVAQNQATPPAPAAVPDAPAAPPQLPPAPSEPENATPPPPPVPPPNRVTLNAGMLISVRLLDGLSTGRSAPGDAFTATLDHELVADGFVIAERGARAEGRVVSVDRGDKVHGGATLAIELSKLRTSDDQVVSILTDAFTKHSEPDRSADAGKVVGGAAIGAIIGAIAGGGKGAAIGAGAGGGAGAGDVMLTRKPATLPSETRITFRLRDPVTVTEQIRQ